MEKINKLRHIFDRFHIDGYLISKNDEFFSEYVSKQKDRLNYITNFTGSYGFGLILKNKNYLFVDGRYTLQAYNESGKFFKIFTFPNVMPYQFLRNKNLKIGFDPKLFTNKTLDIFFTKSKCNFKPVNKNLIDEIWKRRTKKNEKKFFLLPNKFTSVHFKHKVNKIANHLKNKNADFQFITASENSAWLLNLRGFDEEYSPIPHGYILINKYKEIKFFCNLKKISLFLRKKLKIVKFLDLKSVASHLGEIRQKKFIIDKNTCSNYFEKVISDNNKVLNFEDPIYSYKAIKNKIEIKNIINTHLHDGAALTKYLFWVKKNFSKKKITEISGSKKLLSLRKKNKKFKFLSFPTISGTGSNGAIIHYKPSLKTNKSLKKGEIYLVDSGGQYEFGTTDVTRTISLKNSDKRIQNIFTRVLKGHIAVANYKINKNTTGSEIDYAARRYLKQIGLNYSHGTGHGVGYFLNVHEGPHAITKKNKVKLNEGMIISNEPGYYEKNKFGIRIENLIYIKKTKNKKFFKNLTMVPIDKDLININLLNSIEKNWLNNYHNEVYNNLKDKMNKSEIIELRNACSAI